MGQQIAVISLIWCSLSLFSSITIGVLSIIFYNVLIAFSFSQLLIMKFDVFEQPSGLLCYGGLVFLPFLCVESI